MTIKEVAGRLEIAFPDFDIGSIRRVIIGNAKDIKSNRLAWDILIADPKDINKEN